MKWLALILMTLDHIAVSFESVLPHSLVIALRLLGRLSLPLFAEALVLGFRRTRSVVRYAGRLFLLASVTALLILLIQVWLGPLPFVVGNVVFTLAASLVALKGFDLFAADTSWGGIRGRDLLGRSLQGKKASLAGLALLLASLVVCEVLRFDYATFGLSTVLLLHICLRYEEKSGRMDGKKEAALYLIAATIYAFVSLLFVTVLGQLKDSDLVIWLQPTAALALPLIPLFRRIKTKDGSSALLFYIYYPAHLVLLALLRSLIQSVGLS